jgi:hypothetical protein
LQIRKSQELAQTQQGSKAYTALHTENRHRALLTGRNRVRGLQHAASQSLEARLLDKEVSHCASLQA